MSWDMHDRPWMVEPDPFRASVGEVGVGPVDIEGSDWRISMADALMGYQEFNGRTYIVIAPQAMDRMGTRFVLECEP